MQIIIEVVLMYFHNMPSFKLNSSILVAQLLYFSNYINTLTDAHKFKKVTNGLLIVFSKKAAFPIFHCNTQQGFKGELDAV